MEFIKNIDKSSPLLLVAISNNEVLKFALLENNTTKLHKSYNYTQT
ncbi:hypothetical protein EHE21_05615 [Proteus sp. GOKU]|nr:hypothetical protein EHE21_05615 [Proteus sp. GOKU]QQP27386.1 hypothetical protein D7029_05615 [Proteus vulgaris]